MREKLLAAILCLVLVLILSVVLVGCSDSGKTSDSNIVVTTSLEGKPVLVGDIPSNFPLTKDNAKLNIIISVHDNIDQSSVYVWKKYKKMTGIDVDWTEVSVDDRDEVVNTALTNKRNIDLILRCRLTSNMLTQYANNGLLLDLAKDDLLKKSAPNCWAYLQSHPEALASVTNPDGTIYSLPQVNSGSELRVARKLYINKNWLKNVNMDVPKTTDEFYELLKAFKEKDANGNGDPNDEIPFSSHDWLSIQDTFYGSFGLANRGIHNQIVDYDDKTSKTRLIAASDGYRDYLEYFNKLYSEGLLDHNMFTMTINQWYNNAENDRFGVFANTNLALLPADKANDWVAIEEPLEGPNGDKMCTAIRANFHSTGAAVIPTSCSDPELVLRWLDYFWTDEGTLFYHMGIDGKTFVSRENGTYDYKKKIYDEIKSENKSFDDVVATYSPYPGGGNPTVEIAPYFMGGEMAEIPANAAKKLFEYGPEKYWPSFTFTDTETSKLDTIQSDIVKYTDSMRIEFITGTTSFSQWDEYKAQLKKFKMSEMLDIYQAAVKRYDKLNAKHQ